MQKIKYRALTVLLKKTGYATEITSMENDYVTNAAFDSKIFGAVKITKNASDSSKNKYEGYGICFDEDGTFSKGNINNGRNILIFGVDESSLTHSTNKANNIYVFGDLFVQGINDTTLYAEKVYKTNFAVPNVKFVLSLHYNGDNSYFFVNGTQDLSKKLVKKRKAVCRKFI